LNGEAYQILALDMKRIAAGGNQACEEQDKDHLVVPLC